MGRDRPAKREKQAPLGSRELDAVVEGIVLHGLAIRIELLVVVGIQSGPKIGRRPSD